MATIILSTTLILSAAVANVVAANVSPAFPSVSNRPGQIQFLGSDTAELYTREIAESFQGVLDRNFVSEEKDGIPAGFVHASPVPQVWSGTFWSRDGGTFLRELVLWGHLERACKTCACLMKLVEKNADGYYAFPEYFEPGKPKSGSEIDGTASIVIAMVLLWERLPEHEPFRSTLYDFLSQESSPVRYLRDGLEKAPLLAGGGEFGGGCGITGLYCNVVQNYLAMLALESVARMEARAGHRWEARRYRKSARTLMQNIQRYLVKEDGSWIWCVEPASLKPDPAVLDFIINKGFGGLNGPGCMYADALGFTPLDSRRYGVGNSLRTFETLFWVPQRRTQFEKYGIWVQFDEFRAGCSSGPSYGDGYALQTMLLFDKMDMADKALHWMAYSTYQPVPEYQLPRESPYHFYERSYSPDAVGKIELEVGCGALNLVNVTEQLKVARLILGVDDPSPRKVRIIPRIPPSWKGVRATGWPINTPCGIVRADIDVERLADGKTRFAISTEEAKPIGRLDVRLPSSRGGAWHHFRHVARAVIEE